MPTKNIETVLLIVAHPDDETLWAGGAILLHPEWKCFVISTCRGGDAERAHRFRKALEILKADGAMADLDDGPDQIPLSPQELESTILDLLPSTPFDLLITHHPKGEYTHHLRHEEVSKAVVDLWNEGKIAARNLWTFAYQDADGAYFPEAMKDAGILILLPLEIWNQKYQIITQTYGFAAVSWEAKACPKTEAFNQIHKAKPFEITTF
ncbi:MAG TPA: PIG-L family deacetylase [Catalimonadaceae bacterium]|nr:PIG-L family deacetylase [Catalimonadaceae bacterium]HPI11817.1 PIG-L family deacetylase [Catalimonadaceae bacterium]